MTARIWQKLARYATVIGGTLCPITATQAQDLLAPPPAAPMRSQFTPPPGPATATTLPDGLNGPASVGRSSVPTSPPAPLGAGSIYAQAAPGAPAAAPQLSPEMKQAVQDYLSVLEAKKAAAVEQKKLEDQEKGTEVGSDVNLQAHWVEGRGMTFTSGPKDWDIHLGGRFQFEMPFFQQPNTLKGAGTGSGGIAASGANGGLGVLDDGAYFRRVRLRADGTAYEQIEFIFEVDFEQLNYITYDHMWVGMKDLPFFDTVRIGQHKVPMGMENLGSDYHLTFLERSAGSDAFSTLFAPGIWWSESLFDKSVAVQTMVHKTQQMNFYTSSFGDGNYASSTRLAWTPIYCDEGREILMFGADYQWRTGNLGREIAPGGTGTTFGDSQDAMRFRARGDLRDAIGIGSGNNLGGDASRYVDTGYFLTQHVQTFMPEFLLIYGPFSIQAESYFVFAEAMRNLYIPGKAVGAALGNGYFTSSYAEVSYFLTGERRGYDRRFGTYDRPVLDENGFAIKDIDGNPQFNWGAWQLAYRYTYMDLNSGGLNGGQMTEHTVGLNWYINNMCKIQFQYANTGRLVNAPAVTGNVNSYGILAQWYF